MRPSNWYLLHWNAFQNAERNGTESGFKTTEGEDEIYNFRTIKKIINKWASDNNIDKDTDVFWDQYNPNDTSSDQFSGLVNECSKPKTTGCPIGTTACPYGKQLNQYSREHLCYPLHDTVEGFGLSQNSQKLRNKYIGQTWRQYCDNCVMEQGSTDKKKEYEDCMKPCGCIKRHIDPEYISARKHLEDALKITDADKVTANQGVMVPDHCWWKPCIEGDNGANNAYLIDPEVNREACPTLNLCKQENIITAGRNIINSGKIDMKSVCNLTTLPTLPKEEKKTPGSVHVIPATTPDKHPATKPLPPKSRVSHPTEKKTPESPPSADDEKMLHLKIALVLLCLAVVIILIVK